MGPSTESGHGLSTPHPRQQQQAQASSTRRWYWGAWLQRSGSSLEQGINPFKPVQEEAPWRVFTLCLRLLLPTPQSLLSLFRPLDARQLWDPLTLSSLEHLESRLRFLGAEEPRPARQASFRSWHLQVATPPGFPWHLSGGSLPVPQRARRGVASGAGPAAPPSPSSLSAPPCAAPAGRPAPSPGPGTLQ